MGDVSYLCYVPSIVGLRLIPNGGRTSRRREEFAKSRAERRTTAVFSLAKPFLGKNTT